MGTIEIRCYGELNDFLPPARRRRAFSHSFAVPGSVKDALECAGVPHPEIDLILVNGEPAAFGHRLAPGDRVAAYRRFRRLDVAAISPIHVAPLAQPRFLLDGHLGRLARHLRLLGLEAAHRNDADDAALAAQAAAEDCILLTRDLDLLKRSQVRRGYRVRNTNPEAQAVEVVQQFDLAGRLEPFSRCLPCGEPLAGAVPADGAVPPGVAERHREYRRCPRCGRFYWRGSHYRRLAAFVARVEAAAQTAGAATAGTGRP